MSAARLAALAAAMLCATVALAEIPLAQRRSAFEDMARDTQGMQRDDTANPGMLWVRQGEELWNNSENGKSCASCHGAAEKAMRGVATRYPAFAEWAGRPVDISGQVNQCRTSRQAAPAFKGESQELLALGAYIGLQSRGEPIGAFSDFRLAPFIAKGEALYSARLGQLNFSCANCHTDNWGKKLAGALIPQAHPSGYPLYRLEWQAMGSLQRRMRNCMTGVRAEPFEFGADEFVDLELFLMRRARGMSIETPAVRP